jgi:hypothetical protein
MWAQHHQETIWGLSPRRRANVVDGVVSLLDTQHTRMVESLWVELENEFGLSSRYAPRIAHFSYQIAEGYDIKRLGAALEQFAPEQRPFCVRTSGLALFTGASPVLYIPVVRSTELTQLHAALWQAVEGVGAGVSHYYYPDHWMPHITLAQGDLDNVNLPEIIRRLSGRNFTWEMVVNNVAFIAHTGDDFRLKFRFGFGTREND